jgi:hypothetical protein
MTPLKSALVKISSHPSSRLIVSNGHAWVVLHSFTPANRILFEVASNLYLPKDKQLSEEQIKTLHSWGYEKRRQKRSIGMMTYLSSEEDINKMVEDIERIFSTVFGLSNSEIQCFFQQDVKHSINNQALHAVMRKLVSSKQHNNRITLYQKLLNAQLLVYVNDDDTGFFPYDTIGEFITYAAFTDDKYIQQFDPRGCSVKLVQAYELIPALIEKQAGSLMLNPKGDIRGELYRNELKSIASALSHYKS